MRNHRALVIRIRPLLNDEQPGSWLYPDGWREQAISHPISGPEPECDTAGFLVLFVVTRRVSTRRLDAFPLITKRCVRCTFPTHFPSCKRGFVRQGESCLSSARAQAAAPWFFDSSSGRMYPHTIHTCMPNLIHTCHTFNTKFGPKKPDFAS